jgi:hypothetical protein
MCRALASAPLQARQDAPVETWARPDERVTPLDEEEEDEEEPFDDDEPLDDPVVSLVADGAVTTESDVVVLEAAGSVGVAPVPS